MDKDAVKRSILVVDDEDFLREGIVRLLGEAGWKVHEADNGVAALRIFREHPIEVVLTDLLMPQMDGLQLLRAIQEIDPDVPTVVLTGYGSLERCIATLKAGAADFLTKPFEDPELVDAIERAWRGRSRGIDTAPIGLESRCHYEVSFPAEVASIPRVVFQVEAMARVMGFGRRRAAIRRAIEEALKNAVQHGAGENRDSPIKVEAVVDDAGLTIAVTDPGPGFSPRSEPRSPEELGRGRGVFLIRSYADEARWPAPGNRVEIHFRRVRPQ